MSVWSKKLEWKSFWTCTDIEYTILYLILHTNHREQLSLSLFLTQMVMDIDWAKFCEEEWIGISSEHRSEPGQQNALLHWVSWLLYQKWGYIVNNIAYMDKKKILGDISTKNKYYLGKKLFFYKL